VKKKIKCSQKLITIKLSGFLIKATAKRVSCAVEMCSIAIENDVTCFLWTDEVHIENKQNEYTIERKGSNVNIGGQLE